MKPLIALAASVAGLILAIFKLYSLTRYGTPNPAFAKSLMLNGDFWVFVGSAVLCLGSAFTYYWIESPSSHFKTFIRGISPFSIISIALTSCALIGIPVSKMIGPWDIIGTLLLMIGIGLVLLVSFVLAVVSLFSQQNRFFSIFSVFWLVAVCLAMYAIGHLLT